VCSVPAAIAPGVTNPVWLSNVDATNEAAGIECHQLPSTVAGPAGRIARRLAKLVG